MVVKVVISVFKISDSIAISFVFMERCSVIYTQGTFDQHWSLSLREGMNPICGYSCGILHLQLFKAVNQTQQWLWESSIFVIMPSALQLSKARRCPFNPQHRIATLQELFISIDLIISSQKLVLCCNWPWRRIVRDNLSSHSVSLFQIHLVLRQIIRMLHTQSVSPCPVLHLNFFQKPKTFTFHPHFHKGLVQGITIYGSFLVIVFVECLLRMCPLHCSLSLIYKYNL